MEIKTNLFKNKSESKDKAIRELCEVIDLSDNGYTIKSNGFEVLAIDYKFSNNQLILIFDEEDNKKYPEIISVYFNKLEEKERKKGLKFTLT